MFKKRAEKAIAHFQDRKILLTDPFANYFGLQSRGMKQIRGNGILILTEKELFFELYIPKKELTIPIYQLKAVETTSSFLGKTKFKKLLKIIFHRPTGEKDAAAWLVKNLDEWKITLKQQISH